MGKEKLDPQESGPSSFLSAPIETKAVLVFPMMAIFQGYAAYVVLQHYLKSRLDANSGSRQDVFTAATTLMHWGKLIMRVGHDAIFASLTTRSRVVLAMVVTALGVVVPPIFVWALGSQWLGWAFIHYGLLGI